jgi:hypothetical protein
MIYLFNFLIFEKRQLVLEQKRVKFMERISKALILGPILIYIIGIIETYIYSRISIYYLFLLRIPTVWKSYLYILNKYFFSSIIESIPGFNLLYTIVNENGKEETINIIARKIYWAND